MSPARTVSYTARVNSGSTPLVAFVPPSQPIASIGARAASQPVRKANSGRSGRTAAISRPMWEMSPLESLMPVIRGNSSANDRTVATSIGEASMGML
jgi:hypothetical protein